MERISDFKLRQLQQLQTEPLLHTKTQTTIPTQENSFDQVLQQKLQQTQNQLQFSKHSQERIQQRGIEMTEDLLAQMNEAADSARQKGAKDVVMITQQAAFVVSVANNTVITAMNGNEMKNNIFTKIDGAFLL